MSIGTLLVIILLVVVLGGGLPVWEHSRSWGYGPSGGVGLLLLIVVLLIIFKVL